MTDDGVLDIGRIQTQLLHPAGNLFFYGVVKDRIEDDDALRRRDAPHGVLGLADEIQVVKHLDRFGIPRGSLGRPLLPLPAALAATLPTLRSRRGALAGSCRARAEALEIE